MIPRPARATLGGFWSSIWNPGGRQLHFEVHVTESHPCDPVGTGGEHLGHIRGRLMDCFGQLRLALDSIRCHAALFYAHATDMPAVCDK